MPDILLINHKEKTKHEPYKKSCSQTHHILWKGTGRRFPLHCLLPCKRVGTDRLGTKPAGRNREDGSSGKKRTDQPFTHYVKQRTVYIHLRHRHKRNTGARFGAPVSDTVNFYTHFLTIYAIPLRSVLNNYHISPLAISSGTMRSFHVPLYRLPAINFFSCLQYPWSVPRS